MNSKNFWTFLFLAVGFSLAGEVSFPTLWSRAVPYAVSVTEDPAISSVCVLRAQELLNIGQLSHYDGGGLRVGSQMVGLGFQNGEWGEILGSGADVETVFLAWMKSPSHKALLQAAHWESFGWGVVKQNNVEVVVVRFWRP